jgi:hypothetical protein
MFRYQGAMFINEKGKVMDINGNVDAENRNIEIYTKHGRINQQWDLIYVDEYPEEPKKGELNKEFGFYVERDFFVVSMLPENRYLEVINNINMVIKTSNGNKGQKWYFDQKSKTVKSRFSTGKSFDIKSSGRTNAFQIYTTNSGWW